MRLLIVAALTIGLLGAGGPAQATHRGLPPVLQPAGALYPEGVAWDPSRQALLVGSFTTPARISAVGRDGVARTVVTDPDVPGFVGMQVDAPRHRIVAVYGSPTDPGRAGVGIYDLATGAQTRSIPLDGFPNDVTLARDGTAYVTDSAGGAINRIDLAGTVSTVVRDPRLGGTIGANGIVRHPSGYLLTVNYTTGKLYRFARGRLTEVWTPKPLFGGDGMALRLKGNGEAGGGMLLVVTNALGGTGVSALHELWLSPGGGVALPLRDHEPWPDPAPTTVAVTPYGDYVLDGRLDAFLAGGTATDFVLRRSP